MSDPRTLGFTLAIVALSAGRVVGHRSPEEDVLQAEQARTAATYAWDAIPISTARLSAELWQAVKDKDWAMVGGGASRLWNIDKHYQTIAGGGATAQSHFDNYEAAIVVSD